MKQSYCISVVSLSGTRLETWRSAHRASRSQSSLDVPRNRAGSGSILAGCTGIGTQIAAAHFLLAIHMCVQVRLWFLCNAVCLRESRIHQRIFGTLIVLNLAQLKPNPAALPAGWQHSWRVPAYGLLPSQRKLSLAARMAPSASASLAPAGTPRACRIAGLPAAAKEAVQQDRCRHNSTGVGTDVRHSCTHPSR